MPSPSSVLPHSAPRVQTSSTASSSCRNVVRDGPLSAIGVDRDAPVKAFGGLGGGTSEAATGPGSSPRSSTSYVSTGPAPAADTGGVSECAGEFERNNASASAISGRSSGL